MSLTQTDIVVVGAGPGGYAAAFYAADHGKKVILVEKDDRLGGVCLNRGCIPSKALLHSTGVMTEARELAHRGITFNEPKIEVKQLRQWKESVIEKLAGGIQQIASKRQVKVIKGRGYFEDSQTLRVETEKGQQFIKFDKAIVAVGSRPAIPHAFDLGNPRIMTSTEALELEEIPQDLLVVGGGYIGMELGTVYAKLGSQVVLVEALEGILMGADKDLVRPVVKFAEKNFKEVRVNTKVAKMATSGKKIKVVFESESGKKEELYDRVLISIGRVPNNKDLGLENTQVKTDQKGFIEVNDQLQTNDPHIYAIGDIAGGVMLAHKASKEARIAVDAILGEMSSKKDVIIPAVVFTDPEVAWCGLTEAEARKKGIAVKVARFPWAASGKALSQDRPDGLTKLIIEPETDRILGVGLVGAHAGDLISEGILAVEMGATAFDLSEVVHPHPTLGETLMEAAEAFYGHSAHTYTPKREPVKTS